MGVVGGPKFSTTILELASGHERRNVNWKSARSEYDAAQSIKDRDELDELLQFFYARRGRAYSFRFKDWSDYKFENEQIGLTTGLAAPVNLPLTKLYNSGGVNYLRRLTKPVRDTLVIRIDGTDYPEASTHDVSCDFLTGIVSLSGAMMNGFTAGIPIYASGEFDVPCRFDTDHMETALDSYNVYSWGSIPLVEVRDD